VTWEGEGDYLKLEKTSANDKVTVNITALKPTDKRLLIIR
jgi:hypothetical protein